MDFQRKLLTGPRWRQTEHGNLVVSQLFDGHVLSEPRGTVPAFSHQEPRVPSSSIHAHLTFSHLSLQRMYRASAIG